MLAIVDCGSRRDIMHWDHEHCRLVWQPCLWTSKYIPATLTKWSISKRFGRIQASPINLCSSLMMRAAIYSWWVYFSSFWAAIYSKLCCCSLYMLTCPVIYYPGTLFFLISLGGWQHFLLLKRLLLVEIYLSSSLLTWAGITIGSNKHVGGGWCKLEGLRTRPSALCRIWNSSLILSEKVAIVFICVCKIAT